MRVRALLLITAEQRITVAYVATSQPEARRLNWGPTQELIRQLGAWDEFEFNETRLEIKCKRTGSIYAFFGAENRREVNKLRGQPFREFQIDEGASHDIELLEYMITEAVGPRLGEWHAATVLGGTPGHVLRGFFYERTRDIGSVEDALHRPYKLRDDPAFKDWIGYSSHAWDMVDVLSLPGAAELYPAMIANWDRALLEKAQRKWSDTHPIWLREFRGRWAADSTTMIYQYRARLHGDEAAAAGVPDGALWNQWSPYGDRKLEGLDMIKAAIAALPRGFDDWMFGYGIDLGARDPFALNIKAFSPSDGLRRFFHVFSFEQRGMYTRQIATMLIGEKAVALAFAGLPFLDELGGLFGVTGWPIAIVADHSGNGQTILDDLAKTYGIKIKAADRKNKRGSWEIYNGDLTDGRIIVLADTPLERQLSSLQFKLNEFGIPDENKADPNHSADSALYIRIECSSMFSTARDPAPDPDSAAKSKPKKAQRDAADWAPPRRPSKTDRGEFGSLLSRNNFGQPDRWGNS
jgi:hypothetical protein